MEGRTDGQTHERTDRHGGRSDRLIDWLIDSGMDGQTQTEHKMKAQYVFYDEDDLGLSDCP